MKILIEIMLGIGLTVLATFVLKAIGVVSPIAVVIICLLVVLLVVSGAIKFPWWFGPWW